MDVGVTENVGPASTRAGVRTAYLLSRYPAVSHTFFLDEVIGLRALGMEIETVSINAPDRALTDLPEVESAEAANTYYVKGPGAAGRLVAACVAHPLVLLRGLFAVLRMPRLRLRERGFWLLYLAEAMLIGGWMRERRIRHLHVHFGGAVATVGMLTAKAWRLPWSLTIHGPEELLNVEAYHVREKINAAEFVFCISDFCRSQLCRLMAPEQWSKFSVMRLGVDPRVLQPRAQSVPRRLKPHIGGSGFGTAEAVPFGGADSSERKTAELVCTGRLVAEKGQRVLLEALVLLRARGVSVHATLIGGGPELGNLKSFVAEHGLGEEVTFAGALSHGQTLDRVREADVFALASFAEGISVALMEAMSMGVPCVSTTIAGIPELIANGVDGLLVPPANAEALAAALHSLLKDTEYRQALGARGRERVEHEYNLRTNQERLLDGFARRVGR